MEAPLWEVASLTPVKAAAERMEDTGVTSGPSLGAGVGVIQAFHNKKWPNLVELDIYVYIHLYMLI